MLPPIVHIDVPALKGKLIVVDGPDGMGKSTLVKNLGVALRQYGVDVHETRQPYGNHPNVEPFGQLTRFKEQTKLARWLVHAAAHAQHYQYEILPALAAGKTVLCDRFWWSAIAYNSRGDGLQWSIDEDILYQVEKEACQSRFPDLVLIVAGRSHRPEFTDRARFNTRVADAYEGLMDGWHLPCEMISNTEIDDDEIREAVNNFEFGEMMVDEELIRNKSESEMVIEALQVFCATFCPLPKEEETKE